MFRIKDPARSLKFYTEIIGMELINEHDAGDFKLFFLAFTQNQNQKGLSQSHREGILELTWNKGTEKDEKYKVHNGNDEPQGFGELQSAAGPVHSGLGLHDTMLMHVWCTPRCRPHCSLV